MRTASASALVRRPRAEVFAFHADAANLASVIPFGIVRAIGAGDLASGRSIPVELRVGPFAFGGAITVREFDPPSSFVDAQGRGPFALWQHTHRFEDVGPLTVVRDTVAFQLRGPLALFEPLVARAISAFLAAKLRRTAAVLERGERPSRQAVGPESSRASGGSIGREQEVR